MHRDPHAAKWRRLTYMKNITFSADENKIELAREVARSEHKTLNDAFRDWLDWYAPAE